MKIPLQITFHHLEHSDAIESRIRKKTELLEKFYGRITSMRVLVEPCSGRHRHGTLYRVGIDITLPGGEITVGRNADDGAHEDIYVAIRDSFHAARRQLEDYVRIHFRGRKRHSEKLNRSRVSSA
jgi:putative sigma-54 modulation protein